MGHPANYVYPQKRDLGHPARGFSQLTRYRRILLPCSTAMSLPDGESAADVYGRPLIRANIRREIMSKSAILLYPKSVSRSPSV
jgi:hypothetical protein